MDKHFYASYNGTTGTTDWAHSDGRTGTNPVAQDQERQEALLEFLLFAVELDPEASFEFHETNV